MFSDDSRQRLDKWLWFSRLVKSRPLAVQLINQGYIRIDGRRAEHAATLVKVGDVLTIAFDHRVVVLEILGFAERRGPYLEASKLYRFLDEDEISH